MLRNDALVNSSLNSNNIDLAALEIDFSRTINNLRTLIRSKALGFLSNVLSPNNNVPWPGIATTGLTLALYSLSRSALVGFNHNFTTFLICPRLKPAGLHQDALELSVATIKPAISPFNGMSTYLSV